MNLIPIVSASAFEEEGCRIFNQARSYSLETPNRRFQVLFGLSPNIGQQLWTNLISRIRTGGLPKHLLGACLFMTFYASEHVNHVVTGADEKTFRKWSWIYYHAYWGLGFGKL